jgi:hypothetical protein
LRRKWVTFVCDVHFLVRINYLRTYSSIASFQIR